MEPNIISYDSIENAPYYLFLSGFLEALISNKTSEFTKEDLSGMAIGNFTSIPNRISERTVISLFERYQRWYEIYKMPEEDEQKKYWKEFRRFISKLGISLQDFDTASTKSMVNFKGAHQFFTGCYLIAEDRASISIIHNSYRVLTGKVYSLACGLLHPYSGFTPDKSLKDIVYSRDDVTCKFFDALTWSYGTTIDEASTIIQIMLFIRDDSALWLNYLFDIEDTELVYKLSIINKALLERILSKEEPPMPLYYMQ